MEAVLLLTVFLSLFRQMSGGYLKDGYDRLPDSYLLTASLNNQRMDSINEIRVLPQVFLVFDCPLTQIL
jgi:hypothetical protein